MFQEDLDGLSAYPTLRWGGNLTNRWAELCSDLRNYIAPNKSLKIDAQRKWELVSAFQKTVRRGDKRTALNLVSAMDSLPSEWPYFWRRLCVTACEDIGPADDILAAFVVACSTVFTPKKTGTKNYDLFCFLAEQMCDLPSRSRIYCSYSIIETAACKSVLPTLGSEDEAIVAAIMGRRATVQLPGNDWREWQRRNDWRAEGMLKFVDLRLPVQMLSPTHPIPEANLLFDLPGYCYDMHTRVGLETLNRFVAGVGGAELIRDFFKENKIKGANRALGGAIFFIEGGRIKNELLYGPLCRLEQNVFAYQANLSLEEWLTLQILAEEALQNGLFDKVREEVLNEFFGQKNCNQLQKWLPFDP